MSHRISHWIDGRLAAGHVRPHRARLQPGHRRSRPPRSTSPAPPRSTPRSPAPSAAASEWRSSSLSRRSAVLFAFRELLHARTDELAAIITAEHGKVLSRRRAARSRAAWRTSSSPPACRSCSRAASPSRPPPASTSTRSASRSAWSPASRRSTSRPWCRCGCAPTRSPAATRSSSSRARRTRRPRCSWPSCGRRPGCPTASSPSLQGDKEAVDALLDHPDVAAVSFVGSTPIARYIYETGTAHGKRVQALGGAKNHALVLPDADVDMAADAVVSAAYGSAGERCMALSVAVAVGDVGDRAGRRRSPRGCPSCASATAPTRTPEMGPLITREHRDKVAGYIDAGRAAGRDGGRRRPRRPTSRPTGSSSATTLLDHVTPEMTRLHRRDLRPGAVRRARRHLRGGARAHQRQPVRQRHGDLHPRRRRGPPVPVRRRGGHGRRQRADPGAGGVLLVRRLEGLAVRRHAHVRPGGHATSTPAARW